MTRKKDSSVVGAGRNNPLVTFAAYTHILRIPAARNALLLGLLIRTPMWAGSIILTLHVVTTLGHSYSAAGLLTTSMTIALAVSAPWRGRLLDVRGLRRTVLPQLVVLAVVWSIAPWVGYALLLPLAFVGGLFVVPTFSIVRQVLITSVEDRYRTAALSLDSFATELTFMVGPVLGVLAATYGDTRWALFGFEMLTVLGGVLVWILNPKLLREDEQDTETVGVRSWVSPLVVAILAASAASTVVLTGSDLGIVAALRDMGHPSSIGWVLAIWGLGSAVGALVYGALHRAVPVFLLLGLLSAADHPGGVRDRPALPGGAAVLRRAVLRADDHRDHRPPLPGGPGPGPRRGDGLARVRADPRLGDRRADRRARDRPRRLAGRLPRHRRDRAGRGGRRTGCGPAPASGPGAGRIRAGLIRGLPTRPRLAP